MSSKNPFDNHNHNTQEGGSGSTSTNHPTSNTANSASITASSSSSSRQHVRMASSRTSRRMRPGGGGGGAGGGGGGADGPAGMGEPPIWAARNVEWPIPAALSLANYQKLVKSSKQAGQHLGIAISAAHDSMLAGSTDLMEDGKGGGGGGGTAGGVDGGGGGGTGSGVGSNAGTGSTDKDSNYYGLTGFMSRVLNTSAASEKSDGFDDMHATAAGGGDRGGSSSSSSSSSSKPLRPPRQHCVAAANGWIVAAMECPGTPVLRLVSRWNVRRGGITDQWMALPPPVKGDGRILHVFVDPTASHTLLAAANGEAYYIHSSQRQTIKLAGFGMAADGSLPKDLTGVPGTAVAHRRDEASQSAVQAGLTAGSFVTAIAWDKERGTEGSSKKILLGTSAGEIYEYSLVSPNSEDQEDSVVQPVLLHKLYTDTGDPTETGASVTGLYFERLRTGLLVLAATSGRHKRTRFHTFYSAHNSSFRMVMADQQHASLVELPGSVDFADLRLCNDHFGLRTATGVYYGTIDRSLSGPAVFSGSSTMIVDSGIMPYDLAKGGSVSVPVSLALTPHHIIALGETNEVRFINRVAQKVIQKERVDVTSQATTAFSLDETQMGVGELMMDIRRPDQVWLRKARSLVHISSSQEDRDVWKFTLQKCLDMPIKNRGDSSTPKHDTAISKPLFDRPSSANIPQLTEEEKAQEALFEQAKTLCTNASQKAVVTAVRAEYHLSQGRAELGAKYLAACPPALEPFADTAIRLALPKLGIDDPQGYGGSLRARASLESSNMPLITFLSDKMRVGKMNEDRMTCTMIGAWLTELYLHERGDRLSTSSLEETKASKEDDASHRAILAQFLNANVNNMDAKTIMKILTSHDVSAGECARYAAKSGDIGTAVNAALSVGANNTSGAYDALRILDDAPFELAEPLYYKHASILLARAPSAAGDSFLERYPQGLSPLRLLPSVMHYEQMRVERGRIKQAVEAARAHGSLGGLEESKLDVSVDGPQTSSDGFELRIDLGVSKAASFVNDSSFSTKYLEGVIRLGCRSSAIYSYLISLYAKLEDEEPLYGFLSEQVPVMESANDAARKVPLARQGEELSAPLDMSYALRTVLATGRHFRSAIKLYMGFGMRQQAVELALKVDPSLARELAQDSVELEERKSLWLMIAKNAASDTSSRGGKDVVSRVVSVLKDCGPDVLSIEDVLPFLPDFAQIDQIKDEICEALTSYSSKIEGFLKEMNECDKMCDSLRDEIGRLRNHRMHMKADARCAITNKLVLSAGEPFYVFPSGYVVLGSALKNEVMPCLNEKQRMRVEEIENELKRKMDQDVGRNALQAELDGIIGAECPLTGSVMVESIDRDFGDSEEIGDDGKILESVVERVQV